MVYTSIYLVYTAHTTKSQSREHAWYNILFCKVQTQNNTLSFALHSTALQPSSLFIPGTLFYRCRRSFLPSFLPSFLSCANLNVVFHCRRKGPRLGGSDNDNRSKFCHLRGYLVWRGGVHRSSANFQVTKPFVYTVGNKMLPEGTLRTRSLTRKMSIFRMWRLK